MVLRRKNKSGTGDKTSQPWAIIWDKVARRPYKIVTSEQRPREEQDIEVSGKKYPRRRENHLQKRWGGRCLGKGVGNSGRASVAAAEWAKGRSRRGRCGDRDQGQVLGAPGKNSRLRRGVPSWWQNLSSRFNNTQFATDSRYTEILFFFLQ